jgi:tetratricopeptide (TPR) repeat protein
LKAVPVIVIPADVFGRPRWATQRHLWLLPLVVLAVLPSGAAAQAKPSNSAAQANASTPQAEAELSRRIQAADAARTSGNPEAIGDANQKVVAFALRELGHLRFREHAYAQAVELYRSSLTFEDAADTRVDLAKAKAAAGAQNQNAVNASVKPSHLMPKERAEAAQENRLRIVLGASLNDLGTSEAARNQYDVALKHLQQAEKWNPATTGLARNLGYCAFKVNDFPEAIRALSRALEEQPQDAPVRAMLGMAYFGSNKYADAAKTFEPLGDRGMQDGSVGYAWATSLARSGDLKKASDVLSQVENSNLSDDALLLVGQLWTEITEYQHAVAVFQKVLQRDPSLPKAHFFEGLAYLKWEKWNEAASDFQAELKMVPGDLDAKYTLGFIYLQQGRVDEALALFNEVLAAQPTYAKAQYQIGKIMLDRGQLDDAIAHLEIAARLTPDVDYIHYQLQVAYRKRSRTADADRELETYKRLKAAAREPSSAPKQNP